MLKNKLNYPSIIIGVVIGALCVNILFFAIKFFFMSHGKILPTDYEKNSREKKIENTMLKQFKVEHRSLVLSQFISFYSTTH